MPESKTIQEQLDELNARVEGVLAGLFKLTAISGAASGRVSAALFHLFGIDTRSTEGIQDAVARGPFRTILTACLDHDDRQVQVIEALQSHVATLSEQVQDLADENAAVNAECDRLNGDVLRAKGTYLTALPPRPTYTNSKGQTFFLDEMVTAYLVNVLSLLEERGLVGHGRGTGLAQAITKELRERAALN